jgi:sugar/nucleoside kinase (ribokinase family)
MQKDIQLAGLGNALIDLQYMVSDQELQELEFEKGTMTLVDFDKQKAIINKFADRGQHKMSGGSAANTIISFANLGGKAAYKSHLGDDELGHFYANEFEELGIVLSAPKANDDLTGTSFVMITPDSERTLITALGANTKHSKEHIEEDLIKRSEWLYIEGYKLTDPKSAEAVFHSVDIAKTYDTKVALSFSDKFIVDIFREPLDRVIKDSHLIFCNELEAKSYTGLDKTLHTFEKLIEIVPNVAMTLGANGSLINWNNQKLHIPSYSAQLIDTTGAGDMFAGGFLYGIINSDNPLYAGHLASRASASVVSQLGARLKEDIKILREEIENKEKLGELKEFFASFSE